MAVWSPKLSRGLWGLVQGAVREGFGIADVRAGARAAGETPDAATLSHLFSRAVGGEFARRSEAGTRDRTDPDTYLARRPGGANIADLPRGFALTGAYRQVVRVTGNDPATGQPTSVFSNVQFSRLLSRGEAVDLAVAGVTENCSPECLDDPVGEYWTTWRPG